MEENEKLVADAAKKFNINLSAGHDIFPNCCSVLGKLSVIELKSALFLLMDYIGTEKYISLESPSKDDLLNRLKEILQQNSKTSCFAEQLILEILGTIKNFKLLKVLGVCKHEFLQMEAKQSHIKPMWKMLYNLCDNLNDDELLKIRAYFSLDNSLILAEDIFCHLYHSKTISEENFSRLIQMLTAIYRPDLVQKVASYIETTAKKDVPVYNLRDPTLANPCGLAIIINQHVFELNTRGPSEGQLPFLEKRDGSQFDKERLQTLWTNFGFKTEVYDNLSAMEIRCLFSNLPSRNNKDVDIFVACLLSHGDKDVIYGSDRRPLKIDSLVNEVDKCPFLNGKPKLFFIQACQGQRHQQGALLTNRNDTNLKQDAIADQRNLPQCNSNCVMYSDVYKAVSVIDGFVSYRSPSCGSLFIMKLVENLNASGDKMDLEIIMKDVKASTAAAPCKQMPITSGTLRKSVIFKRLKM